MSGLTVALLCSAAVIIVNAEKCLTPNREEAECILLYNCSLLLDALKTLEPKSVEFVQRSQCGNNASGPLVCCGSSIKNVTNWNTEKPVTQPPTNPKLKLLPDRRYCGYQHFDDYLHTQRNFDSSSIDEFPWMAALIYVSYGQPYGYACAGSLISKRYVLTVAHCVITRDLDLVTVRLGEHNIQRNEDCIKNEQFDECADPVANFGVEQTIVHPDYNLTSKVNDIGLIRLNKTVIFSDFIRPICLPFPGIKLAKIGDNLSLSGWGKRKYLGNSVEVKKKITAQLTSLEECVITYSNTRIVITDNQTCMKESETAWSYSCQGDSGGPVMFSHRNQWHQEGIVSFGKGCGSRYPSVNVKVSSYLDWILDNIRE